MLRMKKIIFLAIIFSSVCIGMQAQSQLSFIDKVLKKTAEDKVFQMQELIGFDDTKAKQLTELEFKFLLEVNKAENCFLCNKKKRIDKLMQNRDADLQKILSRDEYIKYDAVENERIKNIPVHI